MLVMVDPTLPPESLSSVIFAEKSQPLRSKIEVELTGKMNTPGAHPGHPSGNPRCAPDPPPPPRRAFDLQTSFTTLLASFGLTCVPLAPKIIYRRYASALLHGSCSLTWLDGVGAHNGQMKTLEEEKRRKDARWKEGVCCQETMRSRTKNARKEWGGGGEQRDEV